LFLANSLTHEQCIAALDVAFAAIITKVTGRKLLAITALTLANREIVMREMERRGTDGGA
jgi:hypothetical protein